MLQGYCTREDTLPDLRRSLLWSHTCIQPIHQRCPSRLKSAGWQNIHPTSNSRTTTSDSQRQYYRWWMIVQSQIGGGWHLGTRTLIQQLTCAQVEEFAAAHSLGEDLLPELQPMPATIKPVTISINPMLHPPSSCCMTVHDCTAWLKALPSPSAAFRGCLVWQPPAAVPSCQAHPAHETASLQDSTLQPQQKNNSR